MTERKEAVRAAKAWALLDGYDQIIPELLYSDESEAREMAEALSLGGPLHVEIRPIPEGSDD